MSTAEVGYKMRKVEAGAQMFDQYCANCHGTNAAGGQCPPLNQTSGLYGGEVGEGVAWRLEQLGWDRAQPYEYLVSTISRGMPVSTRPEQYPGNRKEPVPGAKWQMAMPAWSQRYGGPLRDDQIDSLATYLANFKEYIPTDPTAAVKVVGTPPPTVAAAVSGTPTPLPTPSVSLVAGDAAKGQDLFKTATCNACHALPGVSEMTVGPSMVGIGTRIGQRITAPGYTGVAKTGEEYVYESVRSPHAFIVENYAVNGKSPMIQFPAERVSDQDIADLIAYLKQAGGS
jgi:mono/diheme cytochrome c family protein